MDALPKAQAKRGRSIPFLGGNESFSACMLVKDDNHKLTEWLAYHYHVLPLRYLVLGVDPRSATSPSKLLSRWRDIGMTIVEWTDLFVRKVSKTQPIFNLDTHRIRQRKFHKDCLTHMKKVNRTWVLLVDSDEYLQFNGPAGHQPEQFDHMKRSRQIEYPSVRTASSLLPFLMEAKAAHEQNLTSNCTNLTAAHPCILLPRTFFGGTMTQNTSKFDAQLLDTQRFRSYSKKVQQYGKAIIDVSRISETDIVTTRHRFNSDTFSVHLPINICHQYPGHNYQESSIMGSLYQLCYGFDCYGIDSGEKKNKKVSFLPCGTKALTLSPRKRKERCRSLSASRQKCENAAQERNMSVQQFINYQRRHCPLLTINHYLGSWESYNHRSDTRDYHTKQIYEESSASAQDGIDDTITPWLDGFVEQHGIKRATQLLQNVGENT